MTNATLDKQISLAKTRAKKGSRRGGAARGAAYLAGRLQKEVCESDDALIGRVCKVLGNHRFNVSLPDPDYLDAVPLDRVPLIEREAAAVEKNVRKLLYGNKSDPIRVGSYVLLAQSGKTYEIRSMFSPEFVSQLSSAGRIHLRLSEDPALVEDCGIVFDYEGAANDRAAEIAALKNHKNKTLARGLVEDAIVPIVPVKMAHPTPVFVDDQKATEPMVITHALEVEDEICIDNI